MRGEKNEFVRYATRTLQSIEGRGGRRMISVADIIENMRQLGKLDKRLLIELLTIELEEEE